MKKPEEPKKPEPKKPEPPKKPEAKKPEETKKPAETKKPEETKKPAATKKPDEGKKPGRTAASDRKELEKELAALRQKVPGPAGQAGGLGGEGVGGTGGSGAATLSDIYTQQIGAIIKRNWRYPSPATRENYVCQLEIVIAPSGEIVNYNVLRGSGKTDFDASTIKAVAVTKQLPAPPGNAELRVVINFNLQELPN